MQPHQPNSGNFPNVVGNLAEVEEQAELARENEELELRSQHSAPVRPTIAQPDAN